MSQNANQNRNDRNNPTMPHKKHEPIIEVSPDDPVGVEPPPGQSAHPSTAPMK